jgi:hypothetical protein
MAASGSKWLVETMVNRCTATFLGAETGAKRTSVSASYDGVSYNISFEYRDPWEWITRLLEDNMLGPFMMFNSVRKYYCEGVEQETFCERVIDEPNTADTRDEFDVSVLLSTQMVN